MSSRNFAFAVFCLLSVVSQTNAAVVAMTNFGAPSFLVDGSSTFSSTPQTASSLNIVGTDQNTLSGTFIGSPVNISGDSSIITLSSLTTPGTFPASGFQIQLYDAEGDYALYTGGNWTALGSGGSSVLTFSGTGSLLSPGPMDFTAVIGVGLFTGGSGNSLNATLTGLTAGAIPEPSRAILLLLGVTGTLLRRRRNV